MGTPAGFVLAAAAALRDGGAPRRRTSAQTRRRRRAGLARNSPRMALEPDSGGAAARNKRLLIMHTGGTFGMDAVLSMDENTNFDERRLRKGTGGEYVPRLRPGALLEDLFRIVPEISSLADIELQVLMNVDSARVGPKEWLRIAKALDRLRDRFDAFVVLHGTDTMAYTGAALSLTLAGFRKPVVITGSQLPLVEPRSDARQNLIDAITCAVSDELCEFALCFGGLLMRANRAQKTKSNAYRAFESVTYPPLATLGVAVEWNRERKLKPEGVGIYRPRFKLDERVIRLPVVPGPDPRKVYGNLYSRGVRGVVLETFGVGNLPDGRGSGWIPFLRDQTKQGLTVYLTSQCFSGPLNPELYRSGSAVLGLGAHTTSRMTSECAVVKLMLHLAHPDIPIEQPLAGEL